MKIPERDEGVERPVPDRVGGERAEILAVADHLVAENGDPPALVPAQEFGTPVLAQERCFRGRAGAGEASRA